MGNLISDAILDRVKDQGVTIVFQNGGGIRASIDQGVVTMGEVLTVLPFQNTLATFQLTGKDIVASLEHGVSMIEEDKGAFPQVAGLKYSFDKSVAPNAGRIKSVEVMEDGAWSPIDEAKIYTVATNNFTRGGGDGYKLFADNAQNAYDYGPGLEQVVADYLTAHRPYTPKLDGRITEVASVAAAPAAEPAAAPAEAAPGGTGRARSAARLVRYRQHAADGGNCRSGTSSACRGWLPQRKTRIPSSPATRCGASRGRPTGPAPSGS